MDSEFDVKVCVYECTFEAAIIFGLFPLLPCTDCKSFAIDMTQSTTNSPYFSKLQLEVLSLESPNKIGSEILASTGGTMFRIGTNRSTELKCKIIHHY